MKFFREIIFKFLAPKQERPQSAELAVVMEVSLNKESNNLKIKVSCTLFEPDLHKRTSSTCPTVHVNSDVGDLMMVSDLRCWSRSQHIADFFLLCW